MFRFDQLFKRAERLSGILPLRWLVRASPTLVTVPDRGARPSTLRGIAALQIKIIHYLELGERGTVARPDIEAARGPALGLPGPCTPRREARSGPTPLCLACRLLAALRGSPEGAGHRDPSARWRRCGRCRLDASGTRLVRGHDPRSSGPGRCLLTASLHPRRRPDRSHGRHHRSGSACTPSQFRVSSLPHHDPDPRRCPAGIFPLCRNSRLEPTGDRGSGRGAPCVPGRGAARRAVLARAEAPARVDRT